MEKVKLKSVYVDESRIWVEEVEHYQALLLRVVDLTQRRVFNDESVPAEEKIVSLFEPHTVIIVNDKRGTQYGHKVNLATQIDGYVTYMNLEDGNPSDKVLNL